MKKLFLLSIFWMGTTMAIGQRRTDLGYYDIPPQYRSYAWTPPTYQLLRTNPRLITGRISIGGAIAYNGYDAYTTPQFDQYYSNPYQRVYTQPGPQYGYTNQYRYNVQRRITVQQTVRYNTTAIRAFCPYHRCYDYCMSRRGHTYRH